MSKHKFNRPVKPYSIGLDIGTNSIGWSVIYDDYRVPSRKMPIYGNTSREFIKKNMMGVLLFSGTNLDGGTPAKKRRLLRGASRRVERKRNRLLYLQEIFFNEMKQVDENFFPRLNESFLNVDDKTKGRGNLFGNKAEESAYYENYPTIYHLREALANNDEKADLRYIYLALAHILKARGNFLIDDPSFNVENNNIQQIFKELLVEYDNVKGTSLSNNKAEVVEILTAPESKTKKAESVLALFPEVDKKSLFANLISLSLGAIVNFKVAFQLDEDFKLHIYKESFDEDLEKLISLIGDDYEELFLIAKKLKDSLLLSGVVTNSKYSPLSTKMVERYEEHKKWLKELKNLVKTHIPERYNDVFRNDSLDGYAGYVGAKRYKRVGKGGIVSEENFYKYIKNLLKNIPEAEPILKEIEKESFLRKQRAFDNGSIPHQVHLVEMKAILARQRVHYPFLKENAAKIEKILSFRIPYYAGPLAKGHSEFAWIVRKADGQIRPWNFDQIIDKEASSEAFIQRLTSFDTYLPEEKVLPKNSILYQTYTVFNEMTKIQFAVEGTSEYLFLTTDQKEKLFNKYFKGGEKLTKKELAKFLELNYGYRVLEIKGIEKTFKAKFSAYHELLNIIQDRDFMDAEENQEILEKVIHSLTVFNDREIIVDSLSKYSSVFSPTVINKLSRKTFVGWGRFSAKLINGIRDEKTGKTILDFLKDDGVVNRNFMQLINSNGLSFKKKIEEAQKVTEVDDLAEVVQNLQGSPAAKKGILQALKIVKEIVKVMGAAPESIVVEMARENQTTNKGIRQSYERAKKLNKAMSNLVSGLNSKLLKEREITNQDLQNEKIYLYCLQNGRDMYLDQELDFDNLKNYDVDHILPQSFIKDDSIDNKVLTSSKVNRGKSDNVPSIEVVERQIGFWRKLQESGLISERKFNNLTKAQRGGLTIEDKAHFVKRQLVETRQITKNVAQILDSMFNPKENGNQKQGNRKVKIITLKSSLASNFRKEFGLYKIRDLNDFHHAHDAYLNAVIAKAILKKYPGLEQEFVYGEYKKKPLKKLFYNYRDEEIRGKATEKYFFYSNLLNFFKTKVTYADGKVFVRKQIERCEDTGTVAWDKEKDMQTVRKTLSLPQVNVVRRVEEQKVGLNGGLFDTNLKSSDVISPMRLVPRKQGLNVVKYGGYQKPTTAYTIILFQKNIDPKIIPVFLLDKKQFEKDPKAFLQERNYLKNEDFIFIKLLKYSLFDIGNGIKRLWASSKEVHKGNEMVISSRSQKLLYLATHLEDKASIKYFKQDRMKEFDTLFEEVMTFAKRTKLSSIHIDKLEKAYAANKGTATYEELGASFSEMIKKFVGLGTTSPINNFLGEKLNQKQYTSLKDDLAPCLRGELIYQSITGLYETRVDLKELNNQKGE